MVAPAELVLDEHARGLDEDGLFGRCGLLEGAAALAGIALSLLLIIIALKVLAHGVDGDAGGEREGEELGLGVRRGLAREELGHGPVDAPLAKRGADARELVEPPGEARGLVDPAAGAGEVLACVTVARGEAEGGGAVERGELGGGLAEREAPPAQAARELEEQLVLGANARGCAPS